MINIRLRKISNYKLTENNKLTSDNQNKDRLFKTLQALKAEIMVKWHQAMNEMKLVLLNLDRYDRKEQQLFWSSIPYGAII